MKNITEQVLYLSDKYRLSYKMPSVAIDLSRKLLVILMKRHFGLARRRQRYHQDGRVFSPPALSSHELRYMSQMLVRYFFENYVRTNTSDLVRRLWHTSDNGILLGSRMLAFAILLIVYKLHGTTPYEFSIRQVLAANAHREDSLPQDLALIDVYYPNIEEAIFNVLNFKLSIVSLDDYFDLLAVRLRHQISRFHGEYLLSRFDYFIEPIAVWDMFDQFYTHRFNLLKQTLEYYLGRSYRPEQDEFLMEQLATDLMLIAAGLLRALLLTNGLIAFDALINRASTREGSGRRKLRMGLAYYLARLHRYRY